MCAGLCPTYWTTFGNAEKNRNSSFPMHEWDHPPFLEFLTPHPPAPQGPMDSRGGGVTSADIVPIQIKFGVDASTHCWDIAQKLPICSHSNENFISSFFRPPGAANPQKGRRHIRNQSTAACKLWRESARGLSRNRWRTKNTYSKTNTSPFALTSELRVIKSSNFAMQIRASTTK